MHEGAIIRSLFEMATKIKTEEKLDKIETITVIAGKFHQIVSEVMFMQFNLMKQEFSGFEKAKLIFQEKEIKVRCEDCGHIFQIDSPVFLCPNCNSLNTEIISGKELHIAKIEGIRK